MSTKPTVTPDIRNNYLLALNALVGQLTTTSYYRLDPTEFTKKYEIDPNFLTVLTAMEFLSTDNKGCYKRSKSLYNVTADQAMKWMERHNSENGIEAEKQAEVALEAIKEVAATNFNDVDAMAKGVQLLEESSEQKQDGSEPKQDEPQVKSKRKSACSTFCGMNHCDTNGCSERVRVPAVEITEEGFKRAVAESGQVIGPATIADTHKQWFPDSLLEPQQLITPFNVSIQTKGLSLTMEVFTTEDQDIVNLVLDKLSRVK